MPDDVPSPIRMFEPGRAAVAAPTAGDTRADVATGPASAAIPEPPRPGSADIPEPVRAAARRVLARDGRDFVLQPWQAGYLVATSEGREGFVPPACGVGRGWLQARLDEELASGG